MKRWIGVALAWLLAACVSGNCVQRTGGNRPIEFSAQVSEVSASLESVMYVVAKVAFTNLTAGPLYFERYEIVWPGGRHEGKGPPSPV